MENVISNLITNQQTQREHGDYEKDGLLYCGKCHTPKQTRLELFNKVQTVFVLCKCDFEKREKEKALQDEKELREKISKLRSLGFPDGELKEYTFEMDDRSNQVTEVARRYVDNFDKMLNDGKGLLLFGEPGTGKSFASYCIANALIDKGTPVLVTNFNRIINTLQGKFEGRQEYIDGLNRFDLLVIDDLASERDSEYMIEQVQNIIDARYRSRLPLIVTTNLTWPELTNPADIRKKRTYSRLLEVCHPVHVEGADRRREKVKREHSQYAELLGTKKSGTNTVKQ